MSVGVIDRGLVDIDTYIPRRLWQSVDDVLPNRDPVSAPEIENRCRAVFGSQVRDLRQNVVELLGVTINVLKREHHVWSVHLGCKRSDLPNIKPVYHNLLYLRFACAKVAS